MSIRNDAIRATKLPQWTGETVFILGGGESLRGFDASVLDGRRVIGVNEAGLSMKPDADVLFWADRRWIEWNISRLHLHTGAMRIAPQTALRDQIDRFHPIKWEYRQKNGDLVGFDTRPGHIAGFDAGGRCINLAYHFGVPRVVMLGFDCHDYPMAVWKRGNWHDAHKLPPLADQRANKFIPAHNAMAKKIAELGLDFEVLNATPGSALSCWPTVKLEDVL